MATQALNFDDIKSSCLSMTSIAESLNGTITSIEGAIGKITGGWEGDASTNYQEEIKKFESNLPDAERQLALSVLFLTSCSNGYEALGQDNVKKLKDLVGGQDYIDAYNIDSAPTPNLDARYGVDQPEQTTEAAVNAADIYGGGDGDGGYGGGGGGGGSAEEEIATEAATDQSLEALLQSLGLLGTEEVISLLESQETTGTINELGVNGMTGEMFNLPDSVAQGEYGIAAYDYKIPSGEAVTWPEGSKEKEVNDIWKEQGSAYKKGIAIINVKGEDRYLVNVSTKYGNVGDCIDLVLEDGTKVKCVIAGHTATDDWGITDSTSGKTNLINFRVQKAAYDKTKTSPSTASWGLEWNSNFKVATINNNGSIIGGKVVPKGTLTGADTTTSTGAIVSSTESSTESSTSSGSGTQQENSTETPTQDSTGQESSTEATTEASTELPDGAAQV